MARKLADSFIREGTSRRIQLKFDGVVIGWIYAEVSKSGDVEIYHHNGDSKGKWQLLKHIIH
jgi:hypothetical protein